MENSSGPTLDMRI
ncbi:hypothetical protein ID866_1451 [Astraeus odoratus]|nr:hypothetical protein ID866_1451 [Astraeus odoratus]